MSDTTRPVPLLGDISLQYVLQIEHAFDGGFVSTRIAGLDGALQQRSGRPSHLMRISGTLFGDTAKEDLSKLQKAAQAGDELTFSADITSALDLQKVVIRSFHAVEAAGHPNRFRYEVCLAESPPLPPPAQVEGFGGLDDFGLGDLGFDTDALGDIANVAGDVAGAVDAATSVMDKLGALASLADLGDLQLGSFLDPLTSAAGKIGGIADNFKNAAAGISETFST
jgi:hypothetical protein